MAKIRVGVIVGGKSGEHEVSLVSGSAVMKHLDRKKYDVIPIGISREGQWLTGENVVEELKQASKRSSLPALLSTNPKEAGLVVATDGKLTPLDLDVIFPVTHGPFGEDGTLQGLLEMIGLPYVGCGVLASSVAMDKILFKDLMRAHNIPQTAYIGLTAKTWSEQRDNPLELSYPVFVKPANMGSSVGITKVDTGSDLEKAVEHALQFDDRVIIEEAVEEAREIEIAVLGGDELQLSVPGEIVASNDFYDYNAKYVDGKSAEIIPAKLNSDQVAEIEQFARQAFKAVDGWGMARVDFLISDIDHSIYLNEMNTIPGFTSISMYSKMFETSGVPYPELLERLIELALERHQSATQRTQSYQPSSNWHQT